MPLKSAFNIPQCDQMPQRKMGVFEHLKCKNKFIICRPILLVVQAVLSAAHDGGSFQFYVCYGNIKTLTIFE